MGWMIDERRQVELGWKMKGYSGGWVKMGTDSGGQVEDERR
jgi:hypothetical protein